MKRPEAVGRNPTVKRFFFILLAVCVLDNAAADTLRIVPESKAKLQTVIAANMPFHPSLQIEVVDDNNNRVTSGVNASLTITPMLSDASICLSADASFTLSNGVGTFPGSICEPVPGGVSLTFESGSDFLSDATPTVTVTGDIYLKFFQKTDWESDGKIVDWLNGAIEDINNHELGWPYMDAVPGRTFHLQTYYTQGTIDGATKSYLQMKTDEEINPETRSNALIGFQSNAVSKILLPIATAEGRSVLSYQDDTLSDFSDKTKFPHYNRICFDDSIMLHSLALALADRWWTKIILIIPLDVEVSTLLYKEFDTLGISIVKEYRIAAIADNEAAPTGLYNSMFDEIKAIKSTRIILSFATEMTALYLWTEAIREQVSMKYGFQWMSYGSKDIFPSGNFPSGCHNDAHNQRQPTEWCTTHYLGHLFMDPYIASYGMQTVEWYHIWHRYLQSDPKMSNAGELTAPGAVHFPAEPHVDLAASYDAVRLYALAIRDLVQANKTLSGSEIATNLRAREVDGLTQVIKLDANGDRMNYKAGISLQLPQMDRWMTLMVYYVDYGMIKTNHDARELYGKFVWKIMDVASATATTFTETQTNTGASALYFLDFYKNYFAGVSAQHTDLWYPMNGVGTCNGNCSCPTAKCNSLWYEAFAAGYNPAIAEQFRNQRTVNSFEGHFVIQEQVHGKLVWGVPNSNFDLKENLLPNPASKQIIDTVPAPYWCTQGCGGNQIDLTNINLYENGECIEFGVCECKKNATTTSDMWSGNDCAVPICSAGCKQGTCTAPDTCECSTGYFGDDCSQFNCNNLPGSCNFATGSCVAPDQCICDAKHFGPSCSPCTCVNGKCSDGYMGDGKCSKCEGAWMGDNCDTSIIAVSVGSILGSLVFLASAYFLVNYFLSRAKLRAALYNNEWIVDWAELKQHEEGGTGRSSMMLSAMSMNDGSDKRKTISCTGTWNGIEVHYQTLDKDSIILSDAIRLEVKQMRDLRHDNIISLVGCCLDSPNVSVLTEIAPKGSLDDLLANEDVKFPWDFRFAVLRGIVGGLTYLHNSEIESHGRLKSTNILIDNRWTAKLTGFGLHNFKVDQKGVAKFDQFTQNPDKEEANWGTLLWTAPEILHTGVNHLDHVRGGTQSGDIYSFGMIVSEVCTRDHPFADLLLEKDDIIQLIKKQKNDNALRVWNDYIVKLNIEAGGPVRPCVKDKQWPRKFEKRKVLKQMMESCWNDDPSSRPTLKEISSDIDRMDPVKGELMDRIVKMLEKYSSNLEDIVSKRTKQLAREKQKTEDLVGRLLPKSVADELKQGKKVEPEHFDFVTVFFSDIVGFTSIAKASTPLQVVTLLNDMYTLFDGISANYDCYKVETIGDAYMVVSGLPIRNGDKHAGEICTVAMDLMSAIGTFKIRHQPNNQMKLRVGIHTGFVVAGVVGLKMPRYCLFGETVNVAAKMESGGAALRIHVSNDTYEILQRLGGYKLDYRGEMEVKGRGMMKTWWLAGKQGYTKELPIPDPLDE